MSFWESKDTNESGPQQAQDPLSVDDSLRADISHRAPSQAAVVRALVSKQDKIINTDEIREGEKNLYFTSERALKSVTEFVAESIESAAKRKQDRIKSADEISEGLSNRYFTPERAVDAVRDHVSDEIAGLDLIKQDLIKSSDDIPEGESHLYFTGQRAKEACLTGRVESGNQLAPTSGAVAEALGRKQNLIKSADEIENGSRHFFHTEERVKAAMAPEISALKTQIEAMAKIIVSLQLEVDSLKPKWSDVFKGGSGELTVVTGITQRGARVQKIHFKSGALTAIDPPMGPVPYGES